MPKHRTIFNKMIGRKKKLRKLILHIHLCVSFCMRASTLIQISPRMTLSAMHICIYYACGIEYFRSPRHNAVIFSCACTVSPSLVHCILAHMYDVRFSETKCIQYMTMYGTTDVALQNWHVSINNYGSYVHPLKCHSPRSCFPLFLFHFC